MGVSRGRRASRLLILSTGAGNVTPEIEAKLRDVFADHLIIPFDPKTDFENVITRRARVVIASGDGSIEVVVRNLADSKHPVGILSLGTFNNFATALGLPGDLDKQIQVVKKGRPRPITLGRVNGTVFLEACAIGLFGETIALGQDMKDFEYGRLADGLANVLSAKPFNYELEGDLKGEGTAMSLVFTNTASVGAGLPVGDSTPREPNLQFSAHTGRTRADIAGRAIASALLMKHKEEGDSGLFPFRTAGVGTPPRVRGHASSLLVGTTPAAVTAEVSAVRVLLP